MGRLNKLLWGATLALLATIGNALAAAPALRFASHEITDPAFGHMRVASLQIPAGWRAQHAVRWDFGSANYPVKMHLRIDAPDGKSWVEFFPYDAVYWLKPVFQPIAPGSRSFGAVYAPGLEMAPAMPQLLIRPARGQMPGLKIVSRRPIDAQRLAAAFNEPQLRGEAMTMRLQYTLRGMPVDEDVYAFYTATNTIPYTGPQGTSYEFHRILGLAHAVGAQEGLLPQVYPLLGHLIGTLRFDPAFQAHARQVSQYIRGSTRMNDPYWGTSERDSSVRHHWTDGQGNYRSSNDAGFNPSQGSGSGPTWQRMEPSR